MTTTTIPLSIEKKPLIRYQQLTQGFSYLILIIMMWVPLMLITLAETARPGFWAIVHTAWILVAALLSWLGTRWYVNKSVEALKYEIDGDTVRIHQGVFNWERKAIPLDRVTDIMLSQGIIMRRFGIWKVDLQTASQGGMGAEGTMLGIGNPKHVRNLLLEARSTAMNG